MSQGTCSQQVSRYYYDKTSGTCKLFTYTGCGGNLNNFYSLSECNERCICSRSKDIGTCSAQRARYFYNTATGLCQSFSYNGCGGNVNNFPDQSACENVCKSELEIRKRCLRRPEFGSCSNFTTRYYYDIKCGCCRTFSYSGCEGNNNNFDTEEQCLNKCESVKQTGGRSGSRGTPVTTATPATSTAATTAAPAGSSGSRAIIIQTNPAPAPGNLNNIIQNLVNMIGG